LDKTGRELETGLYHREIRPLLVTKKLWTANTPAQWKGGSRKSEQNGHVTSYERQGRGGPKTSWIYLGVKVPDYLQEFFLTRESGGRRKLIF